MLKECFGPSGRSKRHPQRHVCTAELEDALSCAIEGVSTSYDLPWVVGVARPPRLSAGAKWETLTKQNAPRLLGAQLGDRRRESSLPIARHEKRSAGLSGTQL